MELKDPKKLALMPYIEEIKSRINEANVLDSLVNELAAQNMAIKNLSRQLEFLKAQRQIRDILLPQVRQSYQGQQSAKVDAGMPLKMQHGFHKTEYFENGKPYRWTGPEPLFYFDLHLDRTVPLKFTLLSIANDQGTHEGLRCFTDNIELPLVFREETYGVKYEAVLMPREIIGLTRIGFLVAKTFTPALSADQDTPSDPRTLGLIFREIVVQPATEKEAKDYLSLCDDLTLLQIECQNSEPAPEAVDTIAQEEVAAATPTPKPKRGGRK